MNYKHEPSAFPYTPGDEESGMTLRDWFAGQVLNGLLPDVDNCTDVSIYPTEHQCNGAAEFAYRMADAMLKAREEQV